MEEASQQKRQGRAAKSKPGSLPRGLARKKHDPHGSDYIYVSRCFQPLILVLSNCLIHAHSSYAVASAAEHSGPLQAHNAYTPCRPMLSSTRNVQCHVVSLRPWCLGEKLSLSAYMFNQKKGHGSKW